MTAKILAFSGSGRKESWNKKLVQYAASLAKSAGAELTYIDLSIYEMPLFNQDIEVAAGLPENAKKLKALAKEHDGFIIASPEYNSSFSPLLKNTIDWMSRADVGEAPLESFKGKYAALISASPGGLGGLRGLFHIRDVLQNIGVTVLPDMLAVGGIHEAFNDKGELTDDKKRGALDSLCKRLVNTIEKLQF